MLLVPISAIFLLLLPAEMVADCAAPSNPGIRICSPTPNATLSYPPYIDFNFTPAFGAQIVKVIMYDNGKNFYENDSGGTGTTWGDGEATNGLHRVVIHAWENSGKIYESTVSFRVIGNGFPVSCPTPASPGINFCVPPPGAVLGTTYPVSAAAKGDSRITAIRLYVDGKEQLTQLNQNKLSTNATVATQGNHTISFVAWIAKGMFSTLAASFVLLTRIPGLIARRRVRKFVRRGSTACTPSSRYLILMSTIPSPSWPRSVKTQSHHRDKGVYRQYSGGYIQRPDDGYHGGECAERYPYFHASGLGYGRCAVSRSVQHQYQRSALRGRAEQFIGESPKRWAV
jgi:hypothetical protein